LYLPYDRIFISPAERVDRLERPLQLLYSFIIFFHNPLEYVRPKSYDPCIGA
jgi:hypothetical protein